MFYGLGANCSARRSASRRTPLSASPQSTESCPFAVAVAASLTAFFSVFDAFRANVLAFFLLIAPAP